MTAIPDALYQPLRRVCLSRSARLGGMAAALVLLLGIACGERREGPQAYAPPEGSSSQIDALFAQGSAERSPGVAALVIHDGVVRHQAGYGLANLETGEAITPATAFRLASVSKQFFAMATMILAESGALSYDDAVVHHLPELEVFGDELTVRHLLNHTGGLPDYYEELEELFAEGRMPTIRETVEVMATRGEPYFAPGERFQYSNPGYEMLALVIERAAGMPAREFLAEKIFDPLGMTNTVVRDESEPVIAHRALGYSRGDSGEIELDDDNRLNHIIGAGGIYSTLEDLFLWDQALYTDKLVSSETLAEAFSPRVTSAASSWRMRSPISISRPALSGAPPWWTAPVSRPARWTCGSKETGSRRSVRSLPEPATWCWTPPARSWRQALSTPTATPT